MRGNPALRLPPVRIAIIIMLAMALGCQSVRHPECSKDGVPYCRTGGTFGGKWFDYYERALSCMEGGCYGQALSDLDEAIKTKPEDERMARTYGMHFADYFPHREKGLIHFIDNDLENAKRELERSVKSEPSAKAFFYLDEVRKGLMKLDGTPVSKPALTAECPNGIADESGEIWTNNDPVPIFLTAEDETYVSDIVLADEFDGKRHAREVFMETSGRRVSAEEYMQLDQGRHIVEIAAKNLLGGQAVKRIPVNVDRSGPVVFVDRFVAGTELAGRVHDESGRVSLHMNGKPLKIEKKNGMFAFSIPLGPGVKKISIRAWDRVGNQTKAELDGNNRALGGNGFPLLASSGAVVADSGPVVKANPAITLSGWAGHETVFTGQVVIEGRAESPSGIANLAVNGKRIVSRQGGTVFFSHTLRPKPGENMFAIEASDKTGRKTIKTLRITRKIPEPFRLERRLCLAVYPFEYRGGHDEDARLFHYRFLKDISDRKRFRMLARKELAKIAADFQPAIKSASPRAMLLGNITKTAFGTEITAQFVEKSTSEILGFADTYAPATRPFHPKRTAETLSEILHRKFPLADCVITDNSGRGITARPEKWDPGKGPVRIQWPVYVYRTGKTMENRGADMAIVGQTVVSRITADGFCAGAMPGIKAGDRVVTQ